MQSINEKRRTRKLANTIYQIDRELFKKIDSEEKAYLLGWIASDGHISKYNVNIQLNVLDLDILKVLSSIICKDIKVKIRDGNKAYFTFSSVENNEYICKHLGICPGKKSSSVKFPKDIPKDMKWHFLRGYFEGDGGIRKLQSNKSPQAHIRSNSIDMLNSIGEFCNIPFTLSGGKIYFCGKQCLDFLSKIYNIARKDLILERKYNLYKDWKDWLPATSYIKCEKFTLIRYEDNFPYPIQLSRDLYVFNLRNPYEIDGKFIFDSGIKILEKGYGVKIVSSAKVINDKVSTLKFELDSKPLFPNILVKLYAE